MTALKTSEIDAYIARPNPRQPIALVFGPDAGLVRERAEALVRQAVDDLNDPFALARLDGEVLAETPERLVEEAHTAPLFGGRRAVWVKAGARNITAAVEMLVNAPPQPDCRVVIEAGDLRRGAPLRTLCERAPVVAALPCYPDAERDLARVIDEEMRAADLTVSADARTLLIASLGGDRLASRSELRKLALYARGKARVEADDVAAVVTDASALALDGVADAAFAGQPGEVETQYAKARGEGVPAAAIVASALRHVAQLHRARLDIEAGTPASEALGAMRAHFRRAKLIESALRLWSVARLERAMRELADAALEARRRSDLADAIVRRALLLIAQDARRKD